MDHEEGKVYRCQHTCQSSMQENDLWVAGFPCQFHSVSNVHRWDPERSGFAHAESKSAFDDVLKGIDKHTPRAAILENTDGILKASAKKGTEAGSVYV